MEAFSEKVALSEGALRRGRYTPTLEVVSLTRPRVRLLEDLAACRILTIQQIMYLSGLAKHSAQRHLRLLFDGGYIAVVPISRSALAGPGDPNDASLLFGSAPNIYVMTKKGLRYLEKAGLLAPEDALEVLPGYGPKNHLFLRHALLIKDMHIWLLMQSRRSQDSASTGNSASLVENHFERWLEGQEATFTLPTGGKGQRRVLPDAWFSYRFRFAPDPLVTLCLLEADRGTERGMRHWPEKVQSYVRLLYSGELQKQSGYEGGRIVVLTLDAARRDSLAARLQEMVKAQETHSGLEISSFARRFWLVSREDLLSSDWISPVWCNLTHVGLVPFLTPAQLKVTALG
ncbi:replication-relaxation family protein [Armatimonas sp.]|uniref:replication-relaxation family protein n=1 Tax=Armatimonas sp. TaxID=1872638 RepID=UPI0037522448